VDESVSSRSHALKAHLGESSATTTIKPTRLNDEIEPVQDARELRSTDDELFEARLAAWLNGARVVDCLNAYNKFSRIVAPTQPSGLTG